MSESLKDFILDYQDDVLRYAYFLIRNEKSAQDLAQETFLKALSVKSLPENPKAYLFQITKNLFFDEKRRARAQEKLNDSQSNSENSTIDPTDLRVWSVLFSLEPDEQELLLLVDREGLSINETSKLLKISESALKSRLFRARENFKKKWNS